MAEKIPMTRLSFTYPVTLKEEIKKIAKKETRNMSQMVQIFIKEGIQKRSKNRFKK